METGALSPRIVSMNADPEKRVGETAVSEEKISTVGSEPSQKRESLNTADKNENNNSDIHINQANDGENLSRDTVNDSKILELHEDKAVEDGGVGLDSLEQKKCEGDAAKVNEVASQSEVKEPPKKNSNDPYAYVDRGDFTSEKFKIEIRGLPKFYGYGELKRFLNDKLKLSSHKVKPTRKKSPWVFVCFRNEEDRQAAIKTLNRLTWKGKMLTAMMAKPAPDPLVKKRKLEHESGNIEKKPRISDDERLKTSTTPYWNLSYEEQLKRKYDYVKGIMCNLADLITSVNPMLTVWIRRQKAKYNGMACNLLDIRKSPNCDGYRNKCEFTIGINEETKQRMVGFRLGSYVQGHVGVGPIDSLKHIPQRMKETVKVFEKFVQASSKEPYNPETHTGHWRLLTLRLTTLGELMVVVVVNSKEVTQADLASAKEEVKEFFKNGEGKTLKVNSLYFQAVGKREAGKEPPMEHVLGATHITESLLGLKFRISPEAFFQVNTPGAGVLYSAVGEMIDLNASTTIVDVCCGTGTIGLSLAQKCGQVLGLEVVAPAIEDAKVNATVNKITNCEFFTGRAEEILSSVLSRAKGKSVYAIVDPPRSGLQQKGIIALRSAEMVEKIVYVSCDPNAALKNFVDLARQTSKTYHGFPLVPICAVPVDMFPHTAHCEVIILFHRVNPVNLPKVLPPKMSDVALLSESLTETPSKLPKTEESSQKEGKLEANKEKPIASESSHSKNRRKSTFPASNGHQGKKIKKMSGGSGRIGRFTQSNQHLPSKLGGKQGFAPKGNTSHSHKGSVFEHHRGQTRALEQERPYKPVGQIWREKSPELWLGNERKSRWKENESFAKEPVSMWKDGPTTHFQKARALSEDEDVLFSGSRNNWKEDGIVERECRIWGGSLQIQTKWDGIESRRRQEDTLPVEEVGTRRENWERGLRQEAVVEPKRWRDDRSDAVDEPAIERRQLMREVEQLLIARRGTREERSYSPFERSSKDNWPQSSHIRSSERNATNEPMWQYRRMGQSAEDGRNRIRRPDNDRSPVCERQISSWEERRTRREEFGDRIDLGERFQEVTERRQVRDESMDHRWSDSKMINRSENMDDKESYCMRRKLGDVNLERNRQEFSMAGDCNLRKSSESLGRADEANLFDMRQERRMDMKGELAGFDSQRAEAMLMEREPIVSRHSEQINRSPYHLPSYREENRLPVENYREKIPMSVRERSQISPERLNDRFDVDRSYRRTDSETYRGPSGVSTSCLMKNERMAPGSYMGSKERVGTFDKYECVSSRQNYSCIDEPSVTLNKMGRTKVDMTNKPGIHEENYGVNVHDSRRSIATSNVFLSNPNSQIYSTGRFASHEENAIKNIMVQRDGLSQIKPWTEHPSVLTKSSDSLPKITSSVDMYVDERYLDGGAGSWKKDKGREEMLEWRQTDKVHPGRSYFSREESNISESLSSSYSHNLSDRSDKRSSRIVSSSLNRDAATVSPSGAEKTFSFSSARAAIGQYAYSSLESTRLPTMSVNSVFPRKAADQYPSSQTISHNLLTDASLGHINQMNSKSYGQPTYTHDRATFDSTSVQGSLKLSSLDFKQPIPSLCQIPTTNYGQGLMSGVSNANPTAGVASQWSTAGISPWEQTPQQRW